MNNSDQQRAQRMKQSKVNEWRAQPVRRIDFLRVVLAAVIVRVRMDVQSSAMQVEVRMLERLQGPQ